MISWETAKSLLFFLGPFLLPKAIAYYRSFAAAPTSTPHAASNSTNRALTILTISALIFLATTLPLFHPENVFLATHSRLQTPGGVILTRLKALRSLTPQDEVLRKLFDAGGLEARLLYARFGPKVLLGCSFGEFGEAQGWLLYAVPELLGWHLVHLVLLGLATSEVLCGRDAAGWRTMAILGGVGLAAVEVWAVAGYDDAVNLRSARVGEVDFLFWKGMVWRGVGLAAFDALLGWVVWLQGTGRGFVQRKNLGERVGDQVRVLEGALAKARGLGVVRNGVGRDREMRGVLERYWLKDEEVMRDVFEEPEVVQAQRQALAKVDVNQVGADAEKYVDGVLAGVQVIRR
ncbi:hypothetical protein Q7P36_010522 [Cladosporium allicinum]